VRGQRFTRRRADQKSAARDVHGVAFGDRDAVTHQQSTPGIGRSVSTALGAISRGRPGVKLAFTVILVLWSCATGEPIDEGADGGNTDGKTGTAGSGGRSTGGSGGGSGTSGGAGTQGGLAGAGGSAGFSGGSSGTGGVAGARGGNAGTGGPTDSGVRPDVATGDVDASGPIDAGSGAVTRFVAMGDTGKGTPDQLNVAQAVKRKCDADGCDFVILLGDNIYESGVFGIDDVQWQDKFEIPYQSIALPFFAVLGNHDYGAFGLGVEFAKGPIEVAYSGRSMKWKMPATHYTFQKGNVGFVALDTNSILWANTDFGSQANWYAGAIAQLSTTWKIVLGHHPYLSNGTHGNAGSYTDLTGILFREQLGAHMKTFVETHVCGTADVYLAGHDHSRQWLEPACGMELLVSGAGAEVTALASRNPFFWESDTLGFLYVVIQGKELRGQFVNLTGAVDYERVVTKP
jgi:tartrate-resistant acid phosphatase type 5